MANITIIGIGLIGGSLALSFKKNNHTITGYDASAESLQRAHDLGVIDRASLSLEEAVQAADFIFICTPVGKIIPLITQILECPLKSGCIITDAGSTKASIFHSIKKARIREDVYFIGGHPMAGSHKSGVAAASATLFENAYYILTPPSNTPQTILEKLEDLLASTGTNIIKMDAKHHDQVVAGISHLPHLIVSLLVNQIADYQEKDLFFYQLAAGGFRDSTRIASSHPNLWADIVLDNRDNLIEYMRDWQSRMDHVIGLLESKNKEEIIAFFERARNSRDQLPPK